MKSKQKIIIVTVLLIAIFLQMGIPLLDIARAEGISESKTWERRDVKKGDSIIVSFPYEISPGNIKIPEGIKYESYNKELKQYTFIALKDLDHVRGTLFYKESGSVVEDGGVTDNGNPSENDNSGFADWDTFKLGKHTWGETGQYAIRIRADKFEKEGTIKISDVSNKSLIYKIKPYVVGYYRTGDIIGNPDKIEKVEINYNDTGFDIYFNPTDHHLYEINYTIEYSKGIKNGYKVYQKGKMIESGGTIEGINTPKGTLKLIKVDKKDESKKLQGAEFELRKDGKIIMEKLVTDTNGRIIVNNLDLGKYKLKETKAPTGYILEDNEIEFEIKDGSIDDRTVKLTVKNESKKPLIPLEPAKEQGKLIIDKVDKKDESKKLQGAEFELRKDGKIIMEKLVTDTDGRTIVNNLDLGKYKLKETKAPTGYILEDNEIEFEIKDGSIDDRTVKLTVKNESKKPLIPLEPAKEQGKLIIDKVDKKDESKKLQGAEFELRKDGKIIIEKLVTDTNGRIIVNNLDLGKYKLKETKAPTGYILEDNEIEFEIKDGSIDDRTVKLTVKNEAKKPLVPVVPEEPTVPILPNIPVEIEPEIPEENPDEELVAELEDPDKNIDMDKKFDEEEEKLIGEPIIDEKVINEEKLQIKDEMVDSELDAVEETEKKIILPKTGMEDVKYIILGLVSLFIGFILIALDKFRQ